MPYLINGIQNVIVICVCWSSGNFVYM